MIETIKKFKTPDGKEFNTLAEANAHVAKTKFQDTINAYLTSRIDWKKGQKTRARNHIADFLAWEESVSAPE